MGEGREKRQEKRKKMKQRLKDKEIPDLSGV